MKKSSANPRPDRVQVVNELGLPRTLPGGAGQFAVSGSAQAGADVLVLGLGPDPGELAGLLGQATVRYLECPEFVRQMPSSWQTAIPGHWIPLSSKDAIDFFRVKRVVYRPAHSLFPSFWGPVLAALQWKGTALAGAPARVREVWLPTASGDLLHREVSSAFAALGLTPVELDREQVAKQVLERLAQARPELFFSLNFHGLDSRGELFHLLRAAEIPVAVWCVDNPFHLLSGLKAPFWKELHLFVTDDWFIPRLRSMGAHSVHHLPLGAWEVFVPPVPPIPRDKVVFVGSSAFPDKGRFFSGLRLPRELTQQAALLLEQGRGRGADWPDYGWWLEKLAPASLWPDKAARLPGFGAEQCSQAWRVHCVRQAAADVPFRVYGDEGWRGVLPDFSDLCPPVDYYSSLPSIYAASRANLNMTSLLLPHGLTQRHFDVWVSGGLLLTDATPGLDIFPEDLVGPVRFSRPEEVPALLERIEAKPGLRRELIAQWREVLLGAHTYRHRMERVFDLAG